jgi:hypothetical protein
VVWTAHRFGSRCLWMAARQKGWRPPRVAGASASRTNESPTNRSPMNRTHLIRRRPGTTFIGSIQRPAAEFAPKPVLPLQAGQRRIWILSVWVLDGDNLLPSPEACQGEYAETWVLRWISADPRGGHGLPAAAADCAAGRPGWPPVIDTGAWLRQIFLCCEAGGLKGGPRWTAKRIASASLRRRHRKE